MSIIDDIDSQESTVNINFDHDWKVIQLINQPPDDDYVSNRYDDQHWKTIQLPHDEIKLDSSTYWYRKHFDWRHKLDHQQHVYLHFDSNNSQNRQSKVIKIVGITLWLNQVSIYSGTLPKQPIELTSYLRTSTENVLVICSTEGYSLGLTAHLVVPRVCSGHINYNDIDEDTAKPRRKTLDYTASFNESAGLIDVFIDSIHKVEREKSYTDDYPEYDHITENEIDEAKTALDLGPIPRLAILMLIVGTRGDVQPFIALAKQLLACGHRVRLATHETFRQFVRENGIEFYPLAGNPADLMSFMVKNAGIVPSISSIIAGDVGKSRDIIRDILESTWKACTEDDDETNVPFTAEAIIANPPSYGHIHCAQKLQIPLHIMFTMPWSPTIAFPHPFCKINNDFGPTEKINLASYSIIEMLTWSGMRDLINEFREDTLKLSPLHTRKAVRAMIEEHVPHTYCWSPSLVPKPVDWPEYINVSGFFFLDLATNYQPPQDLLQFLQSGDPPIYIGFGSITGHDPRHILKVVLEALNATGYRALVSGLATDDDQLPANVFRIGNCPHDWLFQHVSAVCHHGGAGTTAAGLRAGKPTIIVPFFGDQFFWGTMIWRSGAGAPPIPGKRLNTKQLIEAFKIVHQEDTRQVAVKLSLAFQHENGCANAVEYFHRNLSLKKLRSDLEPSFAACYRLDKYNLQISRPVAQVLVAGGMIDESELTIHSTCSWDKLSTDDNPYLPVHSLVRYGQKAFNNLFVDTPNGLKRAASSNNLLTSAREGVECVALGVGKSLGHAAIGCLSFYGDITDALEKLPNLYDPYSDIDKHKQLQVDDLQSGAKAAGHAVWHGFKDGVTGLINKPRTGFEREGILGGAAGAVVAIPNIVVKPIAGTLASITWLSRGVYAEAKSFTKTKQSNTKKRLSLLSIDGHRRSSSGSSAGSLMNSGDFSPAGRASYESGLTIDICREILEEFERIQNEYNAAKVESENTKVKKKENKLLKLFKPQRNHSATRQ